MRRQKTGDRSQKSEVRSQNFEPQTPNPEPQNLQACFVIAAGSEIRPYLLKPARKLTSGLVCESFAPAHA